MVLAAALATVLLAAPVRASDPPTAAGAPSDLDRAFAAAVAAYQGGEYERSILALEGLVAWIDRLPASAAASERWARAMLRLAQAEATLGRTAAARSAMERLLAVNPGAEPDPAQYPPTFRRQFDEARRAVAAGRRHRLEISSPEPGATAWVQGRSLGALPAAVELPPGRYRIFVTWGEGSDASGWVELDRDRVHEVARVRAPARAAGAGAGSAGTTASWSDATAAPAGTATSPFPAEAWAAAAPGSSGAARGPAGPGEGPVATVEARGSPAWMRPTAWATGAGALAAAGVAVWQGVAAGQARADAQAMLRPDGSLVPGADPAAYREATGRYESSQRNAWIAGGAALLMGTASVVLWIVLDEEPRPGGPAIRF